MKKLLCAVVILGILTGTAFAQSPVIVPGERVGNFRLGMTRQEVLKMAPNPQENMPDHIKYTSLNTGNELRLHMVNNQVRSIAFTNKSWSTEEGINLGNYLNKDFAHLISCDITMDKTLLVCAHGSDGLEFDMRLSDATEFGMVMPKLHLSTGSLRAPLTRTTLTPVVAPAPVAPQLQPYQPTQQQWRQLRVGMSEDEVLRLFGQPRHVSVTNYGGFSGIVKTLWYCCKVNTSGNPLSNVRVKSHDNGKTFTVEEWVE